MLRGASRAAARLVPVPFTEQLLLLLLCMLQVHRIYTDSARSERALLTSSSLQLSPYES